MKKRLSGFMLLSVMLMMASGAFAASLSLSPNPASPSLGQNFTIALSLDTATQTKGFSIRFHYNSAVLSFVSANRGPLFNGFNVGWWRVFNGPPNEDPGVVRIECIIFGNGMYTTGPGNLLNLTFNAMAQGYSDLHLSDVEIYAANGSVTSDNVWNDGSIVIGSSSSYTSVIALLEGPFNGAGMNSLLLETIPLTSPYPQAPALLDRIETGMVDWVLLELLDTPGADVVSCLSLPLYQDGSIRSPSKPYIMVPDAPPQGYYIRIRHRNHLDLVSSVPITFVASGLPVVHDLRQEALVDTGTGVKDMGGGMWAMKAGDADTNGVIDQDDHYLNWRSEVGLSGYLPADFDLDGFVLPNDLLDLWRPNAFPLSMPPLNPVQSTLSFTMSDLRVETLQGEAHLNLNIRVAAGSVGSRLGTGIIILDYDNLSFGSLLLAQNHVTVTPGYLLESAIHPYTIIIRDFADNTLALIYEYDGDTADSALLPVTPSGLFNLSIVLQNTGNPTGFSFDELMMQDQQYQGDYFNLYAPVFANAVNADIPAPPEDFSITRTEAQTILHWTAINGCTYNVYTSSLMSGGWELMAEGIEGNSWIDMSSTDMMFYKITANSGRGDR